MKSQVNLKIDKRTKDQAQKMAEDLGLSLSSLVNASLKQFVRSGEVSFSVAHQMTPYLENIIRSAGQDMKKNKNTFGPFETADEMIRSLEK